MIFLFLLWNNPLVFMNPPNQITFVFFMGLYMDFNKLLGYDLVNLVIFSMNMAFPTILLIYPCLFIVDMANIVIPFFRLKISLFLVILSQLLENLFRIMHMKNLGPFHFFLMYRCFTYLQCYILLNKCVTNLFLRASVH